MKYSIDNYTSCYDYYYCYSCCNYSLVVSYVYFLIIFFGGICIIKKSLYNKKKFV